MADFRTLKVSRGGFYREGLVYQPFARKEWIMANIVKTRSRYLSPLSDLLGEGETWTVGFDKMLDELADRWDTAFAGFNEYPHSNIKKTGEDHYRIELDVVGFDKPQLEIEVIDDDLVITGTQEEKSEEKTDSYLNRGIASRSFRQSFMLADYVEVANAKLNNGILEIDLVRHVPAEKKPHAIDIH
jgi:molecular chaperone IbpA